MEEEVSGLAGLFKDSIAHVLDFLLIHKRYEYSKKEIAHYSGIGYKTLLENWNKLEQYQLVKPTKTVQGNTLYTLNMDSVIVKALKKLQHEVMFYDAEKIASYELKRAPIAAIQ
ncbi:MAG TPA: hypothetical protein EYP22_06150 [Methanosarcinales archaeon]|nr:hypothetical protein [Methanosarcinales archaeon]